MARQPLGGWENGLSPQTINSFRQNTPELILRDLQRELGLSDSERTVAQNVLMARGVNKWLKARRDIIHLSHATREAIKIKHLTYNKSDPVQKARLKMLVWFRSELRKICHQPRWVEWPKIADAGSAEKRLVVKGKGV